MLQNSTEGLGALIFLLGTLLISEDPLSVHITDSGGGLQMGITVCKASEHLEGSCDPQLALSLVVHKLQPLHSNLGDLDCAPST